MDASQSGCSTPCGKEASTRAMNNSARARKLANSLDRVSVMARRSRAVVGVDGHVVVAEIAGPHGFGGWASAQPHPHGDFALLHHTLAVFFAVAGIASPTRCHMHIVQMQLDTRLVQIVNAGIADSCQNAA